MTRVEAAAPVRLDFAGGWTDVPPFSAREGGVVVTASIALHARAIVQLGGEMLHLVAEDLDDAVDLALDRAVDAGARLALLTAALRMLPVGACRLTTRSDAPPGSGLGSSGALDVALVAALTLARGESLDPLAVAARGCYLESVEARIPGGRQDQYAAALGGFRCFRFDDPAVAVEPIALDRVFAAELERRLVLCYMGASRFSGTTIVRVADAYQRGDRRIASALHDLRESACLMAEALRAADLAQVGRLLRRNWVAQQSLDAGMCTPQMARLERAMDDVGVLGGKAAGSGAGGSMFFLTADDPAPAVAAARNAGVTVLPVQWEPRGVRAW